MNEVDVVVVGAGLAGLAAALAAAEAGARVVVLGKGRPNATEIVGFNVPGLAPGDSPFEFLADTIRAGDSINDPRLVARMSEEIGVVFKDLERRGLAMSRHGDAYHLRLAADNRYPRIVHRDDRTGPALLSLLRRELRRLGVPIQARTTVLSLECREGCVAGLSAHDARLAAAVSYRAGAVVLAAGGAGQVYAFNTNAAGMVGQGYALALEAGAELVDMEFVQFEPFILAHPPSGRGYAVPTTVITNDGGRITNAVGAEFLPRDRDGSFRGITKWAMARSMFLEIRAGRGAPHGGVTLDLRHLSAEVLAGYPRLERALARAGLNPARDVLEVTPAAHHFMGGVRIDERCRTGVPGLYAAGENAGGLHGANRMAGNSGPDGLVFGRIAGMEAAKASRESGRRPAGRMGRRQIAGRAEGRGGCARSSANRNSSGEGHGAARRGIRRVMLAETGVARDAAGLERARAELVEVGRALAAAPATLERAETLAMAMTALAVVTAALLREESRGAHFRLDHPGSDDRRYLGSFALRLERREGPSAAAGGGAPCDPEALTHRWLPRAPASPTARAVAGC